MTAGDELVTRRHLAAGAHQHETGVVAELPTTFTSKWRYALKPASWSKLFVPAWLGQALGMAHLGRVDIPPALVGMALTSLLLAFVVLMNDWADREVDRIKRRMFPRGCSPKTIPDGILPPHQVLGAAVLAGTAAVACGYWAEHWLNRDGIGLATIGCLSIFVAYSLPPLRLNYRGGGELLEMLGCGFALPWLHAYMQGGLGAESLAWLPRPWGVLPGLMMLCLASAIASGLSDEQSDRKGGKRTFVTMWGNPLARRVCEALVLGGAIAWLLAGIFSEHIAVLAVLPAVGLVLWSLRGMMTESTNAVTNAFQGQARYKLHLHTAVWRGARTLAICLVLYRVFLG